VGFQKLNSPWPELDLKADLEACLDRLLSDQVPSPLNAKGTGASEEVARMKLLDQDRAQGRINRFRRHPLSVRPTNWAVLLVRGSDDNMDQTDRRPGSP